MNVLLHRYTPWQEHIRCSTNIYAEQFIKHNHKTTYMSALLHPGRLLQERRRKMWQKGFRFEKGAYTFSPLTLVPFTRDGVFSKEWAADKTYEAIIPSLESKLEKGHGKPDVVWTVPPGSSALGKIFPDAKLIMQVVDYYPAFLGERIKAIEKRDYERADHIFIIGYALANYLIDELGVKEEKITVLGQGVDLEKYQKEYSIPQAIKDLPGPRAIWVGLTSKGDEPLFEEVAKYMEAIGGSFIMLGPRVDWADNMAQRYRCVHALGAVMPSEVPAYLKHSDIGIMLYDRNKEKIYKGQHPLKLYEYAAAGLAILSTHHEEFDFLKPPVSTIRTEDEVKVALRLALENLKVEQQKVLNFAEEHTWEKAFLKAERIIKSL